MSRQVKKLRLYSSVLRIIMKQIYFGFLNASSASLSTLEEWNQSRPTGNVEKQDAVGDNRGVHAITYLRLARALGPQFAVGLV